jgi:hypothetical protein
MGETAMAESTNMIAFRTLIDLLDKSIRLQTAILEQLRTFDSPGLERPEIAPMILMRPSIAIGGSCETPCGK